MRTFMYLSIYVFYMWNECFLYVRFASAALSHLLVRDILRTSEHAYVFRLLRADYVNKCSLWDNFQFFSHFVQRRRPNIFEDWFWQTRTNNGHETVVSSWMTRHMSQAIAKLTVVWFSHARSPNITSTSATVFISHRFDSLNRRIFHNYEI